MKPGSCFGTIPIAAKPRPKVAWARSHGPWAHATKMRASCREVVEKDSKPPADKTAGSTDCKNAARKKRKTGGQPGHDRKERNAAPEKERHSAYEYNALKCPHCGGDVSPVDAPPRRTQQLVVTTSVPIETTWATLMWSCSSACPT